MNRTKMNREANEMMKQYCVEHDIMWCEICGGLKCQNYFLTFCHKHKRRFYYSAEQLADPKEWVLAGVKCHQSVEYDKKALEEVFNRCR